LIQRLVKVRLSILIFPSGKFQKKCIEGKKETTCETENRYPSWHDKVILIAEDDEINFMYLREILKKTGSNNSACCEWFEGDRYC